MPILHNGADIQAPVIATVMEVLEELLTCKLSAFLDCVDQARHPGCRPHLPIADYLGLIDANGLMHDATRAVILSAVTGDGMDMALQAPIAED